jgi:outer membrane protein
VTLTLTQALEKAGRNQPSLRQARASTEAAAGRADQARAGYLPQVSLTGSYQRTTGNFSPRPGATSAAVQAAPPWSSNTYDFFNFGLGASQLIYDFGQTSGRWAAAEANRDAAQAAERTAAFTLRLTVERAFFRARAAKALIAVARDSVGNQQRHVDQIKGLVAAGLRPEIDLARVRTDLANARVQLIGAENGLELAKAQLNQAMGEPNPTPYDVAEDEMPALAEEDRGAAALVEGALARRPELTTLQRQRLAQDRLVGSLKGGYGPALSATAGATETGTALDHLVPNWVVGAAVSWPLLQGGLTKGQVREANANLQGLEAQIEAQRLQVRVEIEGALLGVRASKAALGAVADAVANAAEQLRLAEGRYRTGLGNAIELGDSQVALTTAEAQAVQARFDLAAARAQLAVALGLP